MNWFYYSKKVVYKPLSMVNTLSNKGTYQLYMSGWTGKFNLLSIRLVTLWQGAI
jgi:hypothetical protein